MWLIITLVSVIISSGAFFLLKAQRQKLRLGFLSLMMLGMFLMVLVDHMIAFIEGEPLIEFTTDGLVQSGTILGLAMVVPVLVFWIISVLRGSRQPS